MTWIAKCDNCLSTMECKEGSLMSRVETPKGWYSKWKDVPTEDPYSHSVIHACSDPCLEALAKKYGGKIEKRWTG